MNYFQINILWTAVKSESGHELTILWLFSSWDSIVRRLYRSGRHIVAIFFHIFSCFLILLQQNVFSWCSSVHRWMVVHKESIRGTQSETEASLGWFIITRRDYHVDRGGSVVCNNRLWAQKAVSLKYCSYKRKRPTTVGETSSTETCSSCCSS